MRYIAAAALHAKALRVLSIIEEAEERIKQSDSYLKDFDIEFKDWREELVVWPTGKPSTAAQERERKQKAATEAAHRRLCAYYSKILSRLIDLQ